MPVTEVVAIVTTARSPKVLATNRGKVIDWRDANPCKQGNALGRGCKSEGRGFESQCRQEFFS